ncbi:hypothetical protein CWE15_10720 [Aliidiomarina taiwanensis]|uniref:SAM-dependent methyltransferase n=1 Tax=Aliidiomarina taiwanensis TaxID=946228 RepID=A0A432WW36_9GAMM|nr:hypothetical protein [Aliidiomarina taiwanensis]RUO37984.1 hypothetical protein CWE15_10720 [Aliidiomarina taiwanensis]
MTKPLTGEALEAILQESNIIALTGHIGVRLVVLENADYRLLVLNGSVQSVQDKHDPARIVLAHQVPLLQALAAVPKQGRVLELGLGGGSAMNHAQVHFPHLQWLCLEQYAAVVSLYFDHFCPNFLPVEQKIRTTSALSWLRENPQEQFDLVLCDLYDKIDMPLLEACAQAVLPGGQLNINWLPHMQNDALGDEALDSCPALSGWARATHPIAGFRNRVYQLTRPTETATAS